MRSRNSACEELLLVLFNAKKKHPSWVTEHVLTVVTFTVIITGRLNRIYLNSYFCGNIGFVFVIKANMEITFLG